MSNSKFKIQNSKFQAGFSVIEVMLAAALFLIFSSGIVSVVLQGFDANRLGEEETIANQYASEGIEAARSIKNQAYANLVNSAGTGIIRNGSNVWAFSGASNVLSKYTRVITVADVQRDGSGNIVSSGGTADPNTKKVTSTVSWNVSPTRNNSVALTSYLTNWRASIASWASPGIDSSLNITGNLDGVKIAVSGNYAYIARRSGTANFVVVDITNTASPSVVATLTLSGNLGAISVAENYAYLASDDNASELQIVNITNPLSPSLAGTYNAAGNANGNGVFAIGTTAYLVRDNSGDPEFMIVNASVPSVPVLTGSVNIVGNSLDIFVSGTKVYIASDSNTQELQVIDITIPAAPSLAGSLDLTGSNNSLSITGFGTTVVLGRDNGDLNQINTAVPTSPALLGTFNIGGANLNDIALGNSNTYAFVVSNLGAGEFKVIDISTPSSMTLVGNLDVSPNNTLNGVAYDSTKDRAFAVGALDTQELIIFKPQ